MDKITLLQAMLNSEDDFMELLQRLHYVAKAHDSEAGLPIYDSTMTEYMKLIVKQWVCQLVLKV